METPGALWATALLILLSIIGASLAALVMLVRTIAALYRNIDGTVKPSRAKH